MSKLSIFHQQMLLNLFERMLEMLLYHATYGVNEKSILKNGLLLPKGKSNFGMYSGEYIYLAQTPEIAESYAECADDDIIPQEWFDDIIVFQVEVDENDLELDPNNKSDGEDEEMLTYVISKPIAPEKIKRIK